MYMDLPDIEKMEQDASMTLEMLEIFRTKLKTKEDVKAMFATARETVRQRMIEDKKNMSLSKDNSETLLMMVSYMNSMDKLQRIDDFEMVHLNMCDLSERIGKIEKS